MGDQITLSSDYNHSCWLQWLLIFESGKCESHDGVNDRILIYHNWVAYLMIHLQYAGDPIDCWPKLKGSSETMMDNWCWAKGTYTKYPSSNNACNPDNSNTLRNCWHHKYYQWVGLVILLQAGCFYVPRYCVPSYENFPLTGYLSLTHIHTKS